MSIGCSTTDGDRCIFPYVHDGDIFYSCGPHSSGGGSQCATSVDLESRQALELGQCSSSTCACTEHEFTCSDGSCISTDSICDDKVDCDDGGDEFCSTIARMSSGTTASPPIGRRKRNIDCQIPLIGDNGTLSSPNFPDMYDSPFECDWIFIGQPDSHIRLNISTFNLVCSPYCECCDYLEIRPTYHDQIGYDENDDTPIAMPKYCCDTELPDVIEFDDNVAIVRFHAETTDVDFMAYMTSRQGVTSASVNNSESADGRQLNWIENIWSHVVDVFSPNVTGTNLTASTELTSDKASDDLVGEGSGNKPSAPPRHGFQIQWEAVMSTR